MTRRKGKNRVIAFLMLGVMLVATVLVMVPREIPDRVTPAPAPAPAPKPELMPVPERNLVDPIFIPRAGDGNFDTA